MAASMLNATIDDRYILSSGSQTKKLITGGMALITKHGSLRIAFRIRDTAKWLIDDILIEADQWYHVSATWSKDGYLAWYAMALNAKKLVHPLSFQVGQQSQVSCMQENLIITI